MLHPSRRNRALARVRSVPSVRSVLFLCLGNVCRSPYAAARFRQRSAGVPAATSAGFIGPGRPPPDEALRIARSRGVDTSAHRSRLLTPDLLNDADVVVVMDSDQMRRLARRAGGSPPVVRLGDLDPGRVPRRAIRDPWGADEEVFTEVFDRIDRCIDGLLDGIRHAAGPPPETPPSSEDGTRREPARCSPTTSP